MRRCPSLTLPALLTNLGPLPSQPNFFLAYLVSLPVQYLHFTSLSSTARQRTGATGFWTAGGRHLKDLGTIHSIQGAFHSIQGTFHSIQGMFHSISQDDTAAKMLPDIPEDAYPEPLKPLGLPAPNRSASSTSYTSAHVQQLPTDSGDRKTLTVGGPGIVLDLLGPVVLNENGTLSRITNWHQMTEHEQQATQRVIGNRNNLRREALEKEGIVVKGYENRKTLEGAVDRNAQDLD
mmetsp:Transcript_8982/g.15402  ORF Transcript_8982/g.15402 Transcript_8982/m.15402 type:complete len:235 (+) Transcript_8982:171-875(+)|eukprot:CAMPEP_0198216122 /NCGR_PEP_ID=MMETSP1445-20131203/55050_1 /TAXON_ID=36898 /ORGANISM="Pyramimonas sp., Strain CCMP2087" /LENGTH=234 /DNA_ID=CAMNT_0043892215 /DNA_START=112 /DNA_END=816 /DNA_ORIENTATION=+